MHNYWIFLLGCVFFLGTIYLLRKQIILQKGSVRTTGTIVELLRERDVDGSLLFRPLVQFTTHAGQRILWECTRSSNQWENAKGELMKIIYDSRNPQRVISNYWSGYYRVVCCGLVSAMFMLIFFM
jgi:hypothetical protein